MYNENENSEVNEIQEVVDEVTTKKHKPVSKRTLFNVTSIAVATLIIAVVVVLNLLIGAIGTRVNTKIDLTRDKILDFSDETKTALKDLKEDVNIYSLIPENVQVNETAHASVADANDMIDEVLKKYDQMSTKVKYERIDTVKNPEFLKKFNDDSINQYSIIFECSDRVKVVDINDIVRVNYSEVMGTIMTQSLDAEQKFTTAIMQVSNDKPIKIGVVQGHGESNFQSVKDNVLAPENYEAVEINLLDNNISEDINMLFIPAPTKDFAQEEINTLDAYFDKGGNVQLMLDYTTTDMPVLEGYLSEWGVTAYKGYMVEEDETKYYGGSPLWIYPIVNKSSITEKIIEGNYRILYPHARGLKITAVSGVEYTPLLTTSDKSYVKVDTSSMEKTENDISGSAIVVANLTRLAKGEKPNFMIMGGQGIFAGGQYSEANKDFYYNSVAYMTDNESSIYIRPKNIAPNVLLLNQQQSLLIGVVTVIVLPLLMLIAGFVVWIKRRHL